MKLATKDSYLARYVELFVHRSDVYAMQRESGAYIPVHAPFTDFEASEHLDGMASYGTYVIDPADQTVRYVVWDLDIQDENALRKLCELVEKMVDEAGLHAPGGPHPFLMCEFSGNKGYHVWLFFDEPVPAEKVRRWISADFMPEWVEAAEQYGWPTALEVFPKQDRVPEGGFGNLVKLPFGVHAVSGGRSECPNFEFVEGWAHDVEEVQPFPARLVPDREPVTSTTGVTLRRGGDSPHSPFACVDHIKDNGVSQGVRDQAMFHLALYYYGHGIDADVAEVLCLRANEHFQPPLTETEVKAKVSSAYRGTYESARCGAGWLADICPGPCQTGWRVARNSTEVGALLRAAAGDSVEVTIERVTDEDNLRRLTISHPDARNTPTLVTNRRS